MGSSRKSRRERERGVALILVLGALTILAVMLTEFQNQTSAEFSSALAERDAVKAEYAARSGINLTRLLIAAEPTIRNRLIKDPLGAILVMAYGGKLPQIPVWEHSESILGAFNDAAGMEKFSVLAGIDLEDSRNLGLKDARFEVLVVDEDSKININRPARGGAANNQRAAEQISGLLAGTQYDEMFENRGPDGQYNDRQTVCGAIIDWADPDTNTQVCDTGSGMAEQSAAEDSYYESLKRPYERKNAAYDSIEELHRVRGITDEFWTTFIEPDPEDPSRRTVTVWGTDSVNVNTAPPQVLLAMICANAKRPAPLCEDMEQTAMAIGLFNMLKGFTSGIPIFGSASVFLKFVQGKGPFGTMLPAMGVEPVQLLSESELKKDLSAESKVFSIYSTGTVKAGKRQTEVRIHAVVDFRGAPPPGQPRSLEDMQELMAGGGMMQAPTTAKTNSDDGDLTEEGIDYYLQKSPGGNIVYYRID
jgi:general secretion pathway protein K